MKMHVAVFRRASKDLYGDDYYSLPNRSYWYEADEAREEHKNAVVLLDAAAAADGDAKIANVGQRFFIDSGLYGEELAASTVVYLLLAGK